MGSGWNTNRSQRIESLACATVPGWRGKSRKFPGFLWLYTTQKGYALPAFEAADLLWVEKVMQMRPPLIELTHLATPPSLSLFLRTATSTAEMPSPSYKLMRMKFRISFALAAFRAAACESEHRIETYFVEQKILETKIQRSSEESESWTRPPSLIN